MPQKCHKVILSPNDFHLVHVAQIGHTATKQHRLASTTLARCHSDALLHRPSSKPHCLPGTVRCTQEAQLLLSVQLVISARLCHKDIAPPYCTHPSCESAGFHPTAACYCSQRFGHTTTKQHRLASTTLARCHRHAWLHHPPPKPHCLPGTVRCTPEARLLLSVQLVMSARLLPHKYIAPPSCTHPSCESAGFHRTACCKLPQPMLPNASQCFPTNSPAQHAPHVLCCT